MDNPMYVYLLERIRTIPVVDTHEHFLPESLWQNDRIDFYTLLVPYVCDNMQTAGMTTEEWKRLSNPAESAAVRFEIFARYLPFIRFTSYFQVVDRLVRNRYGLKHYTLEDLEHIRPAIQQDFTPQGLFDLQKESGIRKILTFLPLDQCLHIENSSMMIVPTVSDLYFKNRQTLENLEKATGCPICSFDSLLQAIDRLFERFHAASIRAIKFGSAYRRRLDYELRSRAQAEQCFVDYLREKSYGDIVACDAISNEVSEDRLRPLDDYLAFYMVEKARQYGMRVFVHCGIHAWNKNDPDAARISCLRELIALNPEVSFTLLHCGYPYVDDALLLARYYANVHLNLTWVHILDRVKAVELIRRIIHLLPINKIEGFGGDYSCPAQTIAHLEIAQENLARAFVECVQDGEMTLQDAEDIARAWLWENPAINYAIEP